MGKLFVAVLYGGYSSEREVSLRSGRQVFDCLDRALYEPMLVDVCRGKWTAETGQTVDRNDFSVGGRRFDYALIVVHGDPGENGVLQGYLDLVGVPYSSCSLSTSALTMDKSLTKLAVRRQTTNELGFAKEILLPKGAEIDPKSIINELGLPLFVKPNASGSSCGVTKVKREEDLAPALGAAWAEGGAALLEEYIEGTEVSQGVMACGDELYVLPITELVSKNEFFDYEAKYTPGMTEEITPARISAAAAERISKATAAVYRALRCRGVVRVDYIVRSDRPYFIEVNTVPGMSAQSIVPQQWAAVGLSMGGAWDKIIQSTIKQ